MHIDSRSKQFSLFLGAVLVGFSITFFTMRFIQGLYTFKGTLIDPPIPAKDFSLNDQSDHPFRLSKQRGKVVLLFFGYTHCPDLCPRTLTHFRNIADALGEKADRVAFVMITTDPERDSPEMLRGFVTSFNPKFIGLRGTKQELDRVYENYWVYVEKEGKKGVNHDGKYLVAHTSSIFVIDQNGNLVLTFPYGMEANEMLSDIAYLVRNP